MFSKNGTEHGGLGGWGVKHHNFQSFHFQTLQCWTFLQNFSVVLFNKEKSGTIKLPLSTDKSNRLTVLWVSRINYQEAVDSSLPTY